ncbi:protein lethal(2)k10201 [Rhagoletis pomonella]|uniref:protein lethal(2)k10201 n=1 Tax=Rhagoletis pomonella TaxID=28610 RepID=UPI001781519F|nr:protein lethal(2)k10201 [Rhagoletis pomonella]
MFSVIELMNLLNTIPTDYKMPEDSRFVAANQKYLLEYKKLGVITIADELQGAVASGSTQFFCNVPGCQQICEDASTYQTHFNNVHRYLCSICRRSLPTPHLLDLHISERHDSYFATRVDRGEAMYSCLLEECKAKMLTQEQRKDHCIRIHKFPVNFRFEHFCGKSNKKKKSKTETTEAADPMHVFDATGSEIKAISFGLPRERTFMRKDTLKDLTLLKDALDEI